MPIVPDTKDWTWVLERRCPECGFDASGFDLATLPATIRSNADAWVDMLVGSRDLAVRPADDRWSALEYACHVRDVFRLYDFRLHLMLEQDDPLFPNWDQDVTAVEDRYNEQVPATVAGELDDAAETLAAGFDQLGGETWRRTGNRSDGARFTIESFARYLIHDPIHHLHDVAHIPGVSLAPAAAIERVATAERRFAAAVAGLTDETLRRPSKLPGWTVGHVLSHVARNADSHRRRTDAAVRGASVEQYPGGFEGRAAAIEAGAGRSAPHLLADLAASRDGMLAAWREVSPPAAWLVLSADVGGTPRMLRELPLRRWQELEVHLVDLDLGAGLTHRDWPDDFVAWKLPELRRGMAARLPAGADPPAPGSLDERDELAWLFGRWQPAELPVLRPWG